MEDSYFVALGLRECGETISITGELVDHYELTHPGGGTCVVAVYEKHYYRAGNRLTLTVVLDRLYRPNPRPLYQAAGGARAVPLRLGGGGVLRGSRPRRVEPLSALRRRDMAYTEVFYPKLPMEGCADRIQDVIVRSGFSNGQVSERYRLETPGGSVLVLVLVKYLHRTGSEMVVTAVLDELEGRLRLHLTAASALGGMGDECGEEKHIVSKLEKTLEV